MAKLLTRQHFTCARGQFVLQAVLGAKRGEIMESSFGNWRSAAIGLGLTVVVVGAGLAFAFL